MIATEAEAHKEFCHNAGGDNPERAWILSPQDAWGPNPFYRGPAVPHPEDDEAAEFVATHGIEAWRQREASPLAAPSDDIPF